MKREILHSRHLHRDVILDLVLPPSPIAEPSHARLLIVNDGQDAGAMQLEEAILDFQKTDPGRPLLAVAVHAGDRKQEYGVAGHPDYARRGAKANHYADFLVEELLPWIRKEYKVEAHTSNTAVLGFSLGALSAYDLAWNHSALFGTAGLFSGSFWWRSRALDEGYVPSDRIALQITEKTQDKPPLRLWFQTGWLDESADRDDDGLIDSIGDTLDLIRLLEAKGFRPGKDLEYVELGNGKHDHRTMARVLPRFLNWWHSHQTTQVF